jgi:hypothetical protein
MPPHAEVTMQLYATPGCRFLLLWRVVFIFFAPPRCFRFLLSDAFHFQPMVAAAILLRMLITPRH